MLTSEQVCEKFEQLDLFEQKIVSEFIEFLLSKHQSTTFDKKAVLLNTSIWDNGSLQPIEEVRREINTWKPPTF